MYYIAGSKKKIIKIQEKDVLISSQTNFTRVLLKNALILFKNAINNELNK